MAKTQLDEIDYQILDELQRDGRMTNVDLAERVGISAPPCLRRVRVLEEAGYIKGYHAELDHAKLGYGITVFAQVALTQSSSENIQEFQEIVSVFPEVRECHMLTGDADSMLKIVAKDWEAYQAFLTDQLTANDLVKSVRSSISVGTPIDRPGVPVEKDLEKARKEE